MHMKTLKKIYDKHSESDKRVTVSLKNIPGSATFCGMPDKKLLDAVNAMAELAFKNLKKSDKL
jgi:hypothetical protein